MNKHWFGELTMENLEEVTAYIKEMLEGKRYTWVSTNTLLTRPHVRTSQKLLNIQTWYDYSDSQNSHGGFHASDGEYSWGLLTGKGAGKKPYLAFDYDQVYIEQLGGEGNLIQWVIKLEKQDA